MPTKFLAVRTSFALRQLRCISPRFQRLSNPLVSRRTKNALLLASCRSVSHRREESGNDAPKDVSISQDGPVQHDAAAEKASQSGTISEGHGKAAEPRKPLISGGRARGMRKSAPKRKAAKPGKSIIDQKQENREELETREAATGTIESQTGLRNVPHLREYHEMPTREMYPKAPAKWFDWQYSPRITIKEICDLLQVSHESDIEFQAQGVGSKGVKAWWKCSVKTTIPGFFQGEAVGEDYDKPGAARSAWLRIFIAMSESGVLKKMLPDLFGPRESKDSLGDRKTPPQKSRGPQKDPDHSQIPDGKNEAAAEKDFSELDETTKKSEANAKLEIYSYAASLGYVPSCEHEVVKKPQKRRRPGKSKQEYKVTIELKELGISVRAISRDIWTAEIAAALKFKEEAQRLHFKASPDSIDPSPYRVLTLSNARRFWKFYGEQSNSLNLEMEVEEQGANNYFNKAQLKLDGEPIGPPIFMRTSALAKEAAYLVAAVEAAKADPGFFADFKRTLDTTSDSKEVTLYQMQPIFAHLGWNQVNTMSTALVNAYDKGLPDQRPEPKPYSRVEELEDLKEESSFDRKSFSTYPGDVSLLNELAMRESSQEFEEMRAKRAALPISGFSLELVNMIKDNPFSIISAATGSGKTTQVPQIIFEHGVRTRVGTSMNIICTQPRRIAAESVARRVAEERGERLRRTVGYQVRFDSQTPRGPYGITYCTTGILLQRLKSDWNSILDTTSHIIIDETHERSIEVDFLMVVLRRAIQQRLAAGKKAPKLILMSATLDVDLFSGYFGKAKNNTVIPAPVLHVPGRTFEVHKRFLGSILLELFQNHGEQVKGFWEYDKPSRLFLEAERSLSAQTSRRIDWRREFGSHSEAQKGPADARTEEKVIPTALIALTIAHVASSTKDGAILVFLPGIADIRAVHRTLMAQQMLGCDFSDVSRFEICMLHSTIPKNEQGKIFKPPPSGCRRIILSTNIAETSITVPDIKHVVDSGKLNETRHDPQARLTQLECFWESKSNMQQRAGRAGRVQDGNYYAIFSKERAESLSEVGLPEIQRSDLSAMCLSVKSYNFEGSIEGFLAQAIEPPPKDAIDAAVKHLIEIEALLEDEQLTPLGRLLSNLPLHPALGKMIVLGVIFKCLDPLIILGATASENGLFIQPVEHRFEAIKRQNSAYGGQQQSDHLAMLEAFKDLRRLKYQQGEAAMINRAQENFLNLASFRSIESTGEQVERVLVECNLIPRMGSRDRVSEPELGGKAFNVNSDKKSLIKALLLAGVKPNLAVKRILRRGALRTAKEPNALISPVSFNKEKDEIVHPYGTLMAYSSMMRSGGGNAMIFRESTVVTPLMVMLFGGFLEVNSSDEVTMDGWLPFRPDWFDRKHASKLILEYRKALDVVLLVVFDSLSSRGQKKGEALVQEPVLEEFVASVVELLR